MKVIPHLHIYERKFFSTLKFQKRARSYLIGRFVAKQAIARLSGEDNLANILIQSGVFNQPIVTFAYPLKTELHFELFSLKSNFTFLDSMNNKEKTLGKS